MRHEFHVEPVHAGRRMDRWIQQLLPEARFGQIRKLLRDKKVRRNGTRAHADDVLESGDVVVLHLPSNMTVPSPPRPRKLRGYHGPPVAVLAEDDDYLFVDKPSGVACSDDGSDPAALQLWLQGYFADEIERHEVLPQLCHRLDRGTTGVLAIAKTPHAKEQFRRALAAERVAKHYEVVVWGSPPSPAWICEIPLMRRRRSEKNQPRIVAATESSSRALTACTHFQAVAAANGRSLLEATLDTGRTHQIRAHCLLQDLPVVHDPRYGRAGDGHEDGPMLHARRLRLTLDDRDLEVEAPWPARRQAWLRDWGLMLG